MSFHLYLLYLILTYVRPIDMFAPELAAYRPMIVLWGVAFVSAVARAIARREIASRPVYFLLLAAFIGVIAISQVVNGWSGGALISVADFSTSAMLFVLTVLNLTSSERVRKTSVVLLICVVVLAVYAIAAYHFGFFAEGLLLRQTTDANEGFFEQNPPSIPAEDSAHMYLWRVRSLGFLSDPNDFAQAMVMVLPFLWGVYSRGRLGRNLVLVAAPGAVLLYAIYLTQSRGAILGCLALFAFAAHRRLGTLRLATIAAVAVTAIATLNYGGRGFSTQEESAGQRIEAWYEGLQMLQHQPIFGVGYGNFLNHHYLTAHNSFVLCFAELGLVGFFLWVGMLALGFTGVNQVVQRAPADSLEYKLGVQLQASLVGFMTCAWFLSRTYQPGLYLLLALCAAVAWCTRQRWAQSAEGNWPVVPWV